jgi:putative flavoprotein involved in K+ transport
VTLPSRIETVIVGAGHAGLTMSWYLRQGDREHVVLERRPKLGGGWLDRWDGFRLVSPNWTTSFPGDP